MLLPDPDEGLLTFRGQYGRYCQLAAQRLNAGAHKHALLTNPQVARAKRTAVQSAQQLKLIPGVTRADILEAARQAKHAVEAEWFCQIPIVAEVQE